MTAAAKAHYDRGLELYALRRFGEAASELRRGFELEPRREFVFAEAQSWRLAGECTRALPLYRQFMETEPPAVQIEAARLGIERCGPDRAVAVAAPPAPFRATPPPALADASGSRERQAWWRDPWAAGCLGTGAVAVGVGLAFIVASNRAQDEAMSAQTTTYPDFDRAWQTARQRRVVGLTSLIGGAALLAAGGTRLFFLRRAQTPSADSVSLLLGGGGETTVMWQGAF